MVPRLRLHVKDLSSNRDGGRKKILELNDHTWPPAPTTRIYPLTYNPLWEEVIRMLNGKNVRPRRSCSVFHAYTLPGEYIRRLDALLCSLLYLFSPNFNTARCLWNFCYRWARLPGFFFLRLPETEVNEILPRVTSAVSHAMFSMRAMEKSTSIARLRQIYILLHWTVRSPTNNNILSHSKLFTAPEIASRLYIYDISIYYNSWNGKFIHILG